MKSEKKNYAMERLKGYRYSSVFSRSVMDSIMRRDDYSVLQSVIRDYDSSKIGTHFQTYLDFIHSAYRYLTKHYRNEYVYKNSLISSLIRQYKTSESAVFNEYKVGNSIADLVLFNGTSRAYEIKTSLDSDKRLVSQMTDYKRVFQQRYIVTEEQCVSKYKDADPEAGIIALTENRGCISFEKVREAITNDRIDPYLVIRCLRTYEYKDLVYRYYGELPEMNALNAFNICEKLMKDIPQVSLLLLFNSIMKERDSNLSFLKKCDKEFRQICLCLHLKETDYSGLKRKLVEPINI